MINRKPFLGTKPKELSQKDAVHVAIVSVRAASVIHPGNKCRLNEFNEAVASNTDSCGIADPWYKGLISRGDVFWLLINPNDLDTVAHTWEHPKVSFEKPTREIQYNVCLESYADDFGVTYQELMDAVANAVYNDQTTVYFGGKTEEELDSINDDLWELWSEWAEETDYEFPNYGSMCCPEYDYPKVPLFTYGGSE